MDLARFTRVDSITSRLDPHGTMRVPVFIYADEALIQDMDDKVVKQAANVATLPGTFIGGIGAWMARRAKSAQTTSTIRRLTLPSATS